MTEAIENAEEEIPEVEPLEIADQIPGLLPLNSAKTYGVVIGRRYCTLYMRKLYTEDTEVQFPVKGGGMTSKWYFAHQHGPWILSERPYPFDLKAILRIVYQWMILDGIQEAGDFGFIMELLDSKFDDLESMVNALSPQITEALTPEPDDKPKKRGRKK